MPPPTTRESIKSAHRGMGQPGGASAICPCDGLNWLHPALWRCYNRLICLCVRYLQLHSANSTPWHTSHNTIWRVAILPDKLDADPMLLGALNGTIELATCTFREGRREDYITKRCAVAFDPAAQCPNWIEFQEKIANGDADLVAYKERVFGLQRHFFIRIDAGVSSSLSHRNYSFSGPAHRRPGSVLI